MEEVRNEGERPTDGGAWSSDGGVTVELPDGSTQSFDSISAADVKELARDAGVRKFNVKGSDGSAIQASAFPLTSGRIKIEEYNEAKSYKDLLDYVIAWIG